MAVWASDNMQVLIPVAPDLSTPHQHSAALVILCAERGAEPSLPGAPVTEASRQQPTSLKVLDAERLQGAPQLVHHCSRLQTSSNLLQFCVWTGGVYPSAAE